MTEPQTAGDLVIDLRQACIGKEFLPKLLTDAADEIERLRTALEQITNHPVGSFASQPMKEIARAALNKRRQQYRCSNATNLCDYCGKAMCLHSLNDFYCPLDAPATPEPRDG